GQRHQTEDAAHPAWSEPAGGEAVPERAFTGVGILLVIGGRRRGLAAEHLREQFGTMFTQLLGQYLLAGAGIVGPGGVVVPHRSHWLAAGSGRARNRARGIAPVLIHHSLTPARTGTCAQGDVRTQSLILDITESRLG